MVNVSGHGLPIKMTSESLETLEQALEEFSRSLRRQRQCLAILERLNDAACESTATSEAIEDEVSRLIVKHLLEPGDSHPTDEIGEEEKG